MFLEGILLLTFIIKDKLFINYYKGHLDSHEEV